MTRMSKQGEKRAVSFRRRRAITPKTGPKRDHLEFGFRVHENALTGTSITDRYIPKVR